MSASPALYGNCRNDDYVYLNLHAPIAMDMVGLSHEWMHEAGLFGGSRRDEQRLAIQDRTILAELGLDSAEIRSLHEAGAV